MRPPNMATIMLSKLVSTMQKVLLQPSMAKPLMKSMLPVTITPK